MTEYIPTPNRKATRLFVHTAGTRIMCMSISGWRERSSTAIQAAARTTARARRPRTFGEPHPQLGASLTPRRRATSQPDSSTAAGQLIRPAVLTGDSGTNSCAQMAARTMMTSGIQKSQW